MVGNEVRIGGFRVGVVDRILPGMASAGERTPNVRRGRAAGDRRGRAEARQADRAAAGGHAAPDPPALRARPEVHRAHAGPQHADVHGRATRSRSSSRSSRSSSTTSSTSRTTSSAANQRTVFEGYGTALAGRGQDDQPGDPDADPVPRPPRAGDDRALGPRHRAAQPVQGRPGRTSAQIAPVANTYAQLFVNMGTTFEALVAPPRPPAGHDRAAAPDARRRASTASRCSARSCATPASCRGALEPVARGDRALAAAGVRRVRGRHAGAGQGADPLPQHRARCSARSTTWRRTPTRCSALQRPAAHARGGDAAGGVRVAVPDGLQLLELLLDRRSASTCPRTCPAAPASAASRSRTTAPRTTGSTRPRATGRSTCPSAQDPKTAKDPQGDALAGPAQRRVRDRRSTRRATPTARSASAAT